MFFLFVREPQGTLFLKYVIVLKLSIYYDNDNWKQIFCFVCKESWFFSQILPLKVLYFDLKQSSDLYKGKTIECCMQLDMQHRNKGNHNQGKIQVSLYNIDNGEAKKK